MNIPKYEQGFHKSCEEVGWCRICKQKYESLYCYVTNSGGHVRLCHHHVQLRYIYCEKCFQYHPHLKQCIDISINAKKLDEKYNKIIKKQKKLKYMIKYMPGSIDYKSAKDNFDIIKNDIDEVILPQE